MHTDWGLALDCAGYVASGLAAGYGLLALIAAVAGPGRAGPRAGFQPPVTILKPLCGDEHDLYRCLRSFCVQRYPVFQVVFGVCDGRDPALATVRRLHNEFADLDIAVVVDAGQAGCNRKAGNLANMLRVARHDYVVVADSDIRVGPDYLGRVVAPLAAAGVGLVTCLYLARASRGLWSRLGGLFIDDWFAPSVLVSRLLRSRTFAFGSTLALKRATLDAVGGFAAVADYLADDYMLGALIRRAGLRTVLCDYVVDTVVHEPRVIDLLRHEARWMRTLHVLQPLGYRLIFITFTLPLSAAGALLARGQPFALTAMAIAVTARIGLHLVQSRRSALSTWATLCLLPLRDTLIVCVWCSGLVSRRVRWRSQQYVVARDGLLHRC